MEEGRNIDFKKHTSPPASKLYLFKIVFYVLFLGALLYMIFSQVKGGGAEIELEGVEIDMGELVIEGME